MGFSEKLKNLLEENNLTQFKLASAIGFSQRAVSKWINAQAEPTETAIISCAKYFGVSVDYLLGLADDFGNISMNDTELPADEQELLVNFRTLPREEKVQARSYVRYLAERRAPGNKQA